jgi:hypothetical protein
MPVRLAATRGRDGEDRLRVESCRRVADPRIPRVFLGQEHRATQQEIPTNHPLTRSPHLTNRTKYIGQQTDAPLVELDIWVGWRKRLSRIMSVE